MCIGAACSTVGTNNEQRSHRRDHCPNFLTDRSILDQHLSDLQSQHARIAQRALNQYCKALDTYLELPSLLDPIVPNHIAALSNSIYSHLATNSSVLTSTTYVTILARALYTLIKVRGPKRITAHFRHQVHHLRQLLPILSQVESLHQSHHFWHLRYVLYTWLSVAIRVPFPLDTIVTPHLLEQSVNHAQTALSDTGPVAQAATSFLAHFLSRRDTVHHRALLIDYLVSNAFIPDAELSIRTAALALLASVFKHAHRDDVQPHVHRILQAIPHLSTTSSTTEAHLITKLSHRLALTFLPPRPAAWRYTRIIPAIRRTTGHIGPVEPETQTRLSSADSDALEVILDLLLMGLRHRDTVVRWSAAKGIARITARLPRLLAMDVIDAVLAVFEDVQQARSDAAWHGACLAIAELARRGLLLPADQHFRDAFNAVHRAAAFDVRRGANSVGAHVRDAACYAVWAVARAYAKEDVAAFATIITKAMLPLALLDREVNCRRAAAAALQECVGRLSPELFSDGIKLITLVEYFSLGDRNAAYLSIAPKVTQIGDGIHFDTIVKELWNRKLQHWDPAVRALAAKSLARFVDVDKDCMIVQQVLPVLLSVITQKGDMACRHGAVLGIAELVKAVGYKGLQSLGTEIRRIPFLTRLSMLQKLICKDSLLAGKTADDMRIACCQLIQNIAMRAPELYLSGDSGRTTAEEALRFLETILGCGKEYMYAPATSAYTAVCEQVIANDKQWHVEITRKILDGISGSSLCEHQRGFALAAGACGDSKISDQTVTVLCRASSVNKDVEVRRNCVSSLGMLPLCVVIKRITDILDGFSRAMEDYATDDRGDIGSWVREASMKSAGRVVCSVYGTSTTGSVKYLGAKAEAAIMLVLNRIIEQCCSKIDRTRGVAGQALKDICVTLSTKGVYHNRTSALCGKLCEIFGFSCGTSLDASRNSSKPVTFLESADAFPAMRRVLVIPEIVTSAIRGFVSAGGGTGQQAGYACDSLVSHLNKKKCLSVTDAELGEISHILDNREERLLVPALNVLDSLLKRGVLRKLVDTDLKALVMTVRNSWRHRLRNVKLTCAAVGVLSEIASLSGPAYSFQFKEGSIGRDCLEALSIVLGGPLPRLRRITAENLYMILLEVDDGQGLTELPEQADDQRLEMAGMAMEILVDTSWEKLDLPTTRQRRNEFCNALGIRSPVAAKVKISAG